MDAWNPRTTVEAVCALTLVAVTVGTIISTMLLATMCTVDWAFVTPVTGLPTMFAWWEIFSGFHSVCVFVFQYTK